MQAAVAVLRAPSWASPVMVQYEAVLPRPEASAFYDFMDVVGSDEEIEILGSDASRATSLAASDTAIEVLEDGEEATSGAFPPQQSGQPEPEPSASSSALNHALPEELAGAHLAGPSYAQDGYAAAAQESGDGEAGAAEVMDVQAMDAQGGSLADQPPLPAQSTMTLGAGPATDGLDAAAGHLLATAPSPGINLESEGAQPSQEMPEGPVGMVPEDSPNECAQHLAVLESAPGAQQGEDLGDTDLVDDKIGAPSSYQVDDSCALTGPPAGRACATGQKSGSKAGLAKQPKPWRP